MDTGSYTITSSMRNCVLGHEPVDIESACGLMFS